VIPLGIAILRDHLPADRAASGVAIMSSTLGVGGAVGLPLAGVFTALVDWHGIFWTAAAMSLVAALLVTWFVPESPSRTGGRFDIVGAVGLGIALLCLLVPVAQAGASPWSVWASAGLVAAGLSALVGLGWYELRHPQPLVNLRTTRQPAVLLTNLAAILVGVGMFTNFVLVGQRLQAPQSTGFGFGQSALLAGLYMAPAGLGMVIFSPLSARLMALRGAHVTLMVGSFILTAGNVLGALLLPSIALVVMAVCIMSVGTALCFTALPSLILDVVPPAESASAVSLNTLMRTIGTSLSSAYTAALLTTLSVPIGESTMPAAAAYAASYATAAACTLLAVVLSWIMSRLPPPVERVETFIEEEASRQPSLEPDTSRA
jgi:MFS family permease